MKKTVTILVSLTLLLSLFSGCGSNTGSTAAGNDAGKVTTPGGEQSDGLVSVYLLETKTAGPNRIVLRSCKYDEKGNLVEEDRDGYRYTYVYDQNNRNIEWTRQRADGSVHQKNTYQYDENGNEILQVEDYSEYHFEYKSTYNDKGQLIEVVCTRNGEHFDTDTYTYDDQGRVTQYTDGTMRVIRYVYEGNTTRKQELNNDGSVDEENVYTYDDNGKLIREEYIVEGETWNYREYTRDENGKVLERQYYELEDGAVEAERKTVYTYDDNGNLTQEKFYEDGELSEQHTYTYVELKVTPERAEELRLQAEKDAE